jgi:hypothetical protein
MQVRVEVQGVSVNFPFVAFELDVEGSLGIVALILVFAVFYLWMVWAYVKVNPLLS